MKQAVAAVGQDRVDRKLLCHRLQHFERQAGYSDKSGLTLVLDITKRRKCLVDNLAPITELDVMHEQHIHVVRLQTCKRLVDALVDPGTGKVEVLETVAPALRRQHG